MALNIDITPKPIHNPLTPDYEIGRLISGGIALVILFAFMAAFIILISGGMLWITSGGDKQALETARNRIINAIIGLILIASVWAIMTFLLPVVGLSFPTIKLPNIGGGLEKIP